MKFQPRISNGMPTAPVTIAAGIEGKTRMGLTRIRPNNGVFKDVNFGSNPLARLGESPIKAKTPEVGLTGHAQ
jgi:hypothetical protein